MFGTQSRSLGALRLGESTDPWPLRKEGKTLFIHLAGPGPTPSRLQVLSHLSLTAHL